MSKSQRINETEQWLLKADQQSLPAAHFSISAVASFNQKVFTLDSELLTVGRDPSCCQVVLPGTRVSRQHAQLQVFEQGLHVRDLGSANGTFVNDKRVTETFVKSGDALRFDNITLKVVAPMDIINEESIFAHASHMEQLDQTRFVQAVSPTSTAGKPSRFDFLKRDKVLYGTAALCFLFGLSIAIFV